MALEAHAAEEQHEVCDAIGGEALPRSAHPTGACILLTDVEVMSAVIVFWHRMLCARQFTACGKVIVDIFTIKDGISC